MTLALTRTLPSNAEPVLNVLMGTLGAMATSVVGYWVGSSAGSDRKDEHLVDLATRS
jgi:membrane protein DedA with SNARE-associated domain